MYTSVYLLNQNNHDKCTKYQSRWRTEEGIRLKQHIIHRIKTENKQALLPGNLPQNKLSLLENEYDLKGLSLVNEKVTARSSDILNGADLSYLYVTNTHFKNINFANTNISFANLYNVTFTNCLFSYATFYANLLEDVSFFGCDFMERNDIRNCRFTNVSFQHCFIETNLFHSCRFDERTSIKGLRSTSQLSLKTVVFNPKELAELYKSLKNSYLTGKVINKSRDCYYLERQAITRYIIDNKYEKLGNFFLELIAGYGTKPLRVLVWMVMLFLIFSGIFINKIGYPDGLLLSTGAYFTNGVESQQLRDLDIVYKSFFILESFFGIVFTTLFVTVMANLWLRER